MTQLENRTVLGESGDGDYTCECCGERDGTHLRSGYDVCPTDRGDESRYMEEWVCDVCDPDWPWD